MSESMVTRVALAIKRHQLGAKAELATEGPWLEFELDSARAAIEAMREPTPDMLAKTLPLRPIALDRGTIILGEMALSILEPEGFPAKGHAQGVDSVQQLIVDYRGMIDAALEDGKQ